MKELALSVLFILFLLTACKPEDTTEITNPEDSGLSVLSPDGGETIQEGTPFTIRWAGSGNYTIRIKYSIDNGINWFLIADNLLNTGSYIWNPVPNRLSNQCRVKIEAVNGTLNDQSNNSFNIIKNTNQVLELKAPDGFEVWEAGTEQQIKWISSGIDSVRIDYSTNNGVNWHLISVDKNNTGTYNWQSVPNYPTTEAKVRIMDAADNSPSSVSENKFTILLQSKLNLKVPNGGELWQSGSTQKIEWESENIHNVRIQYSTNGGAEWITLVESTPSSGSYFWNSIPFLYSTICKIRILDADDNYPAAVSAGCFTISNIVSKSIKVERPNGGEIFQTNSPVVIKWKSANVQFVTVNYTTNNGVSWEVAANGINNNDSLAWITPGTESVRCRIKVSDAYDPSVFDISDSSFINRYAQSIRVLNPNGNVTYVTGERIQIQWESSGIERVRIQYGLVNGADVINWIDLVSGIQGVWSYEIVLNIPPGKYKIRISDADDGVPSDESDYAFTVI